MTDTVALVTLIVNIGLFLLAGISAIIAWKQAQIAIQAKQDTAAQLQAARDSATAAGRSAEALERAADVAERGEQREPWSVRQLGPHRWSVTNVTGLNVDFVLLASTPPGVIHPEQADHVDVPNGTSVYFQFGGGMADPASANVKVTWRSPVSSMQEQFVFSIP